MFWPTAYETKSARRPWGKILSSLIKEEKPEAIPSLASHHTHTHTPNLFPLRDVVQ